MKNRGMQLQRFTAALLIGAVLFGGASVFAQHSNGLQAAVYKVDITPEEPKYLSGYGPRISSGVHDRIFHKIIVLHDGTKEFILVSTDISVIALYDYDKLAARLKKQFGINPEDFWWSCTHTHSAPEVGRPVLSKDIMPERNLHPVDTVYTNWIMDQLMDGITEVRKRLEPVRLGVAWGYSRANINRRAIEMDGLATLGMNPDGPVDRRIGLIRLEKLNGDPLALIANYPIHGTVLGSQSKQISGDVPGIVAKYVEEKTGAPLLFINGAAGNIAPVYSVYSSPQAGHLSQFNVLLGDKILDANKNISLITDSISLSSGELIVATPLKEGILWTEELKKYWKPLPNDKKQILLPVRFLNIGRDIAIWSAPVELFCEISNKIREHSPFPFTFYYGYTNGWMGYFPAKEQFPYKGYEIGMSAFTEEAEQHLTDGVLGYFDALSAPPERSSIPKKSKKKTSLK